MKSAAKGTLLGAVLGADVDAIEARVNLAEETLDRLDDLGEAFRDDEELGALARSFAAHLRCRRDDLVSESRRLGAIEADAA